MEGGEREALCRVGEFPSKKRERRRGRRVHGRETAYRMRRRSGIGTSRGKKLTFQQEQQVALRKDSLVEKTDNLMARGSQIMKVKVKKQGKKENTTPGKGKEKKRSPLSLEKKYGGVRSDAQFVEFAEWFCWSGCGRGSPGAWGRLGLRGQCPRGPVGRWSETGTTCGEGVFGQTGRGRRRRQPTSSAFNPSGLLFMTG
jgi:hypothetical protein